jgi:hypothetical protein
MGNFFLSLSLSLSRVIHASFQLPALAHAIVIELLLYPDSEN